MRPTLAIIGLLRTMERPAAIELGWHYEMSMEDYLDIGTSVVDPETGDLVECEPVVSGSALVLMRQVRLRKSSLAKVRREMVTRTESTAAQKLGSNHPLGTMLLECTGVPILRSYLRPQIKRMFARFDNPRLTSCGMGLPYIGINHWIDFNHNPLGYFWLIEATKDS